MFDTSEDETLSSGSGLEDADGEADLEAVEVPVVAQPKDEEDVPLALQLPVDTKRKQNSSPSKSPTKKAKTKALPKGSKGKAKKSKPEIIESDLEEVIPTRPTPQRKASITSKAKPPPQRPLALPSANVPPRPIDILVPPPAPQFSSRYEGSDSEDDDMEAVIQQSGDEEHEIDADAIALELANMMSEDESPPETDQFKAAGPLSLNQYAGGKRFLGCVQYHDF
jgi:hypothetical protein